MFFPFGAGHRSCIGKHFAIVSFRNYYYVVFMAQRAIAFCIVYIVKEVLMYQKAILPTFHNYFIYEPTADTDLILHVYTYLLVSDSFYENEHFLNN